MSDANVSRHHHHSSLAWFGVFAVSVIAAWVCVFRFQVQVFLFILSSIGPGGLSSFGSKEMLGVAGDNNRDWDIGSASTVTWFTLVLA